jgi:hypothetical protein
MRKDDWNKPEPNIKAALGCKKLAVFAFFGLFAGAAAVASGVAALSGWLT